MKYKNISDQDLAIPGIGKVDAGKIIESKTEINNPNFEKVGVKEEKEVDKNKK